MSLMANEIVEKLKKDYSWEDIYNKENIKVQQVIPKPSKAEWFLYIHEWVVKNTPKNSKVLDVGCGGGHLSYLLSNDCDVTGVDISSQAIDYCVKEVPNVVFKIMDAEDLKFSDEEFDVVCSNQTLEHLNNPKKSIIEMLRVLKPSGLLLVTIPIQNSLDGQGHALHIQKWGFYELMNLFEEFGNEFKIFYLNKWHRRDPDTNDVTKKNVFGIIFKKEDKSG